MFKRLASILFAACLVAAFALPTSIAEAANQAGYLKIKGSKQGEIKGSVTRKGVEGTTEILSMEHEISGEPVAKTGGRSGGKRAHKPFRLRFYYDMSLPPLYQALTTNEALSEIEYAVFAPGEKGGSKPIFTVRLTDARVSQIRIVSVGIGDDARDVVEVSFTYAKIIWTWTDGGIMAADDWEAPIV